MTFPRGPVKIRLSDSPSKFACHLSIPNPIPVTHQLTKNIYIPQMPLFLVFTRAFSFIATKPLSPSLILMAIPHEKPVSATNSSELEDIKNVEDDERTMEANGCGCFQSLSWLRLPGKSGGSYVVLLEGQKESSRENCLAKMGKKLKKLKCRVMEDGMRKKKRGIEFRYDMQSYVLNFDDGIGTEVDGVHVCLSTPFCRTNEGLSHQRVED